MPVSFQMVVTVKALYRQNQRMRDLKKPGTMIEKEKIKGMSRLQKEVEGISQFIFQEEESWRTSRKSVQWRLLHIQHKQWHFASGVRVSRHYRLWHLPEKKTNKKDDWSDKPLEDFLEILREQPVKDMNDRRNKWMMFSKFLERKEMLGTLAEADPAIPGTVPEKRLVRLHSGGPRVPRDAMLPPICVTAEIGIYNQFIVSFKFW